MAVKKLKPRKKLVEKNNHEKDGVKVAVDVEKRNIDGTKTVVNKKGAIEEQDTTLDVPKDLPKGLATVGLSKGYTINLQNYESARVSCWISRTCKDEEYEIMNNLSEISNMLDEQIEYEVDELNSELEK